VLLQAHYPFSIFQLIGFLLVCVHSLERSRDSI
jgi:hypothetical protein